MKLPFQINLKKKHVLMVFALMLSSSAVFSFEFEPGITGITSMLERTPARMKKTEKESTLVYSFQSISSPDKSQLDKSLEKFRQIDGFVSLTVNAQNEVEVITTKHIAEKENGHILMISARLYGYIGYQIIE